jgi:hypothetical protein
MMIMGMKNNSRNKLPAPQLPAVADNPSARRYHDVAAAAAAHVAEMEEEIIRYRTDAENLRVEVRSLEAIREGLERELTHSRNECDHYRRQALALETGLKDSAQIILGILKRMGMDQPSADQPPSKVDMAALAEELEKDSAENVGGGAQ